jgi:hypothetical protein
MSTPRERPGKIGNDSMSLAAVYEGLSIQVTPSTAFYPNDQCGTTTWITLTDATGDVIETTVEALLQQPTHYPVDPELNGLSGDYHAFMLAQQGLPAARAYARAHGENTGDVELAETRRIRRLQSIRNAAAPASPAPHRTIRR